LDCGDKSFQDGAYPCGEYEARACMCGGNEQNSFATIMNLFGPGTPDTQAPTVSIVTPTDGQQFAPGDDFTITLMTADDSAVQSVALYLDGALAAEDSAAPFEGWAASDLPEGTHDLYVEAIDGGGNVGVSEVVTVEVSLLDQGMPGPGEESGSGDDDGFGTDDGDGLDDGGDGGLPGQPGIDPGFRGGAEPTGCACDVSDSRRGGALGLALFGLALVTRRRAR
jgi:MYXO-CTERM domain-containing protein